MGFRVKVKHLGKGNLKKLARQIPRAQRRAVIAQARQVVETAQEILEIEGKVVTANLAKSFIIEEKKVNQYSVRAEVINTAPYAVFVEFGRRPGAAMPPPEAMEDYIRNAGIAPYDPDTDLDQLAYLIGRHIQQNGIAPTMFMTEAATVAAPEFRNKITLAVNKELAKYVASRRGRR